MQERGYPAIRKASASSTFAKGTLLIHDNFYRAIDATRDLTSFMTWSCWRQEMHHAAQ